MKHLQKTGPGRSATSAVDALLGQAIAQHQQGDLRGASALYKRILKQAPANADALHLSGLAEHQLGRGSEAHRLIARALRLKPDFPVALKNHAIVLAELGRLEDALRQIETHLDLEPGSPAGHLIKANILCDLGRIDDALDAYDLALREDPAATEAMNGIAAALQQAGRIADAVPWYDRALTIEPDNTETLNNRGIALLTLGRLEQALGSFDLGLKLDPTNPTLLLNRGNALVDYGQPAEAVATYQAMLNDASRLPPRMHAEAQLALALAQHHLGDVPAAIAACDKALAIAPADLKFRLARFFVELAPVYASEDEIDRRRAAYTALLQEFCQTRDKPLDPDEAERVVGTLQPYFLPYQARGERELQKLYGEKMCALMSGLAPPRDRLSPPARKAERIRVGFVSGYICGHSVWRTAIRGWIMQLPKDRFELLAYHTGTKEDGVTAEAEPFFARFARGPRSLPDWRDAILADAPHVLIYPEIGMDGTAAALAAMRLAPAQCMAWAHPMTSGYPTIDYFLTSDMMEPADGETHYTEQLVRLPNLSSFYDPVTTAPPPVTRAEFGLRDTAIVYWSGQYLSKYLPRHDRLFAELASAVPDSQIVFIVDPTRPAANAIFEARLARAFANLGLDSANHCAFQPMLPTDRFSALQGLCDVYLDSLEWSSFNTTLEALLHDLPMVTARGRFMRGGHTAALLQRIGMDDFIAEDEEAYVALAARLGRDTQYRTQTRERVAASKSRMFADQECIAALASFLEEVARR